ncbi:MAG: inorganic phosphate transporter, partial [Bdellovibrio bacteriovorus]
MHQAAPAAQAADSPGAMGRWWRLALALGFVALTALWTWQTHGHLSLTLVVAAVFGAYMAMNIGANDVANNVGPAVGARALTLGWAIVIAAVFESMGAIIAGAEVVGTVRSGIIDPEGISDPLVFVWLMMAALLAAALWLNLATAMGAPVSTTHSIVGAVLGAGIAAAGPDVANWPRMGQIAASWVVSPLMGGLIAAAILYLIKHRITFEPDLMQASRRTVPPLIAAMAWAFTTYLLVKGLNQVIAVSFAVALAVGAGVAAAVWGLVRRQVDHLAPRLPNSRESVNRLFTMPLVFAAALLSFAHGSNDVANAVGPLAAIQDTLDTGGIDTQATVPLWILLIGAVGLSLGLALYGPRLIRTVGSEITEIDSVRAYCIAMASALTVIIASQLGLPISTTHVAIGAVFGVGFLREYLKANYDRVLDEIREHHRAQEAEQHVVEAFLRRFEQASAPEKGRMLKGLKRQAKRGSVALSKHERKSLGR